MRFVRYCIKHCHLTSSEIFEYRVEIIYRQQRQKTSCLSKLPHLILEICLQSFTSHHNKRCLPKWLLSHLDSSCFHHFRGGKYPRDLWINSLFSTFQTWLSLRCVWAGIHDLAHILKDELQELIVWRRTFSMLFSFSFKTIMRLLQVKLFCVVFFIQYSI